MKIITVPLSIAALAVVALTATVSTGSAQSSVPAASPSPAEPGTTCPAGKHSMKGKLALLTPEERSQLKAAREAAMKDPSVQAAKGEDKRAFHKALREAMLKADPSIAPILAKLRPHHRNPGSTGTNSTEAPAS